MAPKSGSRDWNDMRGKGRQPRLSWTSPDNWTCALRGLKMFVYYKDEMMPRYTFTKKEKQSYWRGHGFHATSVKSLMDWVREQNPRLR